MTVYLGWLLVILGVAQLYAGAGGVDRTCVRVGTWLTCSGLTIVTLSAAYHIWRAGQ